MLRIMICDDNSSETNKLKTIIQQHLDLNAIEFEICETDSGESLIRDYSDYKHKFDIFFLDIEMKILNGVETAKKIRENNIDAIIIFVTGYSEYVYEGYDVHAFNYILKPYKREKILRILDEALIELKSKENNFLLLDLPNKGLYKVKWNDIIYFKSDRRKVIAVTCDNEFSYYEKLDNLEKKLSNSFVRIHQRYIVNISYIDFISKKEVSIRGEILPISRQRQNEVSIRFARFLLE